MQIAEAFEDFEEQVVIDLGCGTVCSQPVSLVRPLPPLVRCASLCMTVAAAAACLARRHALCFLSHVCVQGMLAIGSALLGAPHVIGVDVDTAALLTALENARQFDGLPVDFIHADVTQLCSADGDSDSQPLPVGRQQPGEPLAQEESSRSRTRGVASAEQPPASAVHLSRSQETRRQLAADIVVCNPPFGSWNKGADVAFLAAAFRVCTRPLRLLVALFILTDTANTRVIEMLKARTSKTHPSQHSEEQQRRADSEGGSLLPAQALVKSTHSARCHQRTACCRSSCSSGASI